MNKRICSLLLCLVLCLGLTVPAFADIMVETDPNTGKVDIVRPGSPETPPGPTGPTGPAKPAPPSTDSDSGSSDSGFSISVPASTNGGRVKVSPHSADRGDTVTITATPDDGYEVGTVTVRDSRGNPVEVRKQGENTYTFEMPNSKVRIGVNFVRSGSAAAAAGGFSDVPAGAYYAEAVAWAVNRGITYGTSSTAFSPDAPCTRGQIVTFLWRAAGSPAVTGTNPFTDVSAGAYYYDAVLWAVSQGITTGTSGTTFSPGSTCTRGQTVTFLYRYEKSPAVTGGGTFTDVDSGAYYAEAVAWAVSRGITNGTSAAAFSPNNTCTRGQIVTFLYRAGQ